MVVEKTMWKTLKLFLPQAKVVGKRQYGSLCGNSKD